MRTHFFGMLSADGQDQEITTFMLSVWRNMPVQKAIDKARPDIRQDNTHIIYVSSEHWYSSQLSKISVTITDH